MHDLRPVRVSVTVWPGASGRESYYGQLRSKPFETCSKRTSESQTSSLCHGEETGEEEELDKDVDKVGGSSESAAAGFEFYISHPKFLQLRCSKKYPAARQLET